MTTYAHVACGMCVPGHRVPRREIDICAELAGEFGTQCVGKTCRARHLRPKVPERHNALRTGRASRS